MVYLAAPAARLPRQRFARQRQRSSLGRGMAWTCAAFSAAAAAGLIACVVDPVGWISSPAPIAIPERTSAETSSFDSRFQIAALPEPEAKRTDALRARASLTTELEFKLRQARDARSAKLRSSDWRGSLMDDSK